MSIKTSHWSVASRTMWVCAQTCMGVLHSGVYYSWGALVQSINFSLNPDYNGSFATNNGLFSGVFILFITTSFLLPVRLILDAKLISEFYFQMIGVALSMIGFIFGSIALRYQLVWLLYVGCVIPCGVGGLLLYQRLVFNHQFFFKSINRHNIGSGLIGFFIGMWTVIFFLLSVPLLDAIGVANLFLVYGAAIVVSMLFPLFSINDEENTSVVAMAASFAYRPHQEPTDKHHQTKEAKDVELASAPPLKQTDKSPSQTGLIGAASFSSVDSAPSPSEERALTHDPLSPTNELPYEEATIHSVLVKHPDFDREVDMNGHYPLYYSEFPRLPQTYILMVFFVCVITPGWGIKLASFSILETLFQVTQEQAANASALYVSFYAIGRLVSGLIAEYIGVFRTYDIMISTSLALLVALPFAAETLPHKNGLHSSGYAAFMTLLCIVGLMYGGAIALFYSIIFDVFGPANYREGFVSVVLGFGMAVLAGGLSSAASFSAETSPNAATSSSDDGQLRNANSWFYAMAGCCGLGLILLHVIEMFPYDYTQLPPGYKKAPHRPADAEENSQFGAPGKEAASPKDAAIDRGAMMRRA